MILLEFELVASGTDDSLKQNQGWGTWAWSYIPSMWPTSEALTDNSVKKNNEPVIFEFAFYCKQLALTVKVMFVKFSSYNIVSKKLAFTVKVMFVMFSKCSFKSKKLAFTVRVMFQMFLSHVS